MNVRELAKGTATVLLGGAIGLGAYEALENLSTTSPQSTREQLQNPKKDNLLMLGTTIEVHKGVDLPMARGDNTIDPNGHLAGYSHPDIVITNPIIFPPDPDEPGQPLNKSKIKFFYRSYWHILLIGDDKTKVEVIEKGNTNIEFQKVKIPIEQGDSVILILKDGKEVEQKVEELN